MQTAANVMVGQSVALSANVDGAPTGATITYKWEVGGEKIKSFTVTNWTPPSAPGVTPVVNEVKPSGHKVELTAADLKVKSPSFYFTNGSFGGTSASVSCTATVNGKEISANGIVKVFRPEMTSFTSNWTSLSPPWGIRTYGGSSYLMLGLSNQTVRPVNGYPVGCCN